MHTQQMLPACAAAQALWLNPESKWRAAGVLSCDCISVAAGIFSVFKAWQRGSTVYRNNLVLLSAGSCPELLGARRFFFSLVQVSWMVEIRPKVVRWFAFNLPKPPQPQAQAVLSA